MGHGQSWVTITWARTLEWAPPKAYEDNAWPLDRIQLGPKIPCLLKALVDYFSFHQFVFHVKFRQTIKTRIHKNPFQFRTTNPFHTHIPSSLLPSPTMPKTPKNTSAADRTTQPDITASLAPVESINRIPRPPNSWILFRAEMSQKLAVTNPDEAKSQAQKSKIVGKMWREADPKIRAEYERRAEIAKQEHAIKYPGYRYTPKSKAVKQREREEKKQGKADAVAAKRSRAKQDGASSNSATSSAQSTPSPLRNLPFPLQPTFPNSTVPWNCGQSQPSLLTPPNEPQYCHPSWNFNTTSANGSNIDPSLMAPYIIDHPTGGHGYRAQAAQAHYSPYDYRPHHSPYALAHEHHQFQQHAQVRPQLSSGYQISAENVERVTQGPLPPAVTNTNGIITEVCLFFKTIKLRSNIRWIDRYLLI